VATRWVAFSKIMNNRLRADFHIHTRYSKDSSASLEGIIARCLKTGISCIAITDHNAIEGALKMKELAPFTVIPGEEILTPNGEVIGYFLKEWIPSGQPIETVFAAIKAQGGLVGLPHPFDTFRGLKNLNTQQLEQIASQVDIVEVFNARSPIRGDSGKARDFASKYDIPGTAGSDAHSAREIGKTYVEMAPFSDKESFLQSLGTGEMHCHHAGMLVHCHSVIARFRKMVQKLRKNP
jgi:predicted metal-dependent phosphoesterase TrpH